MWGWLPGRLVCLGRWWVRAGRGVAARGKQGGWLVLWCLACVVGAGVGLVAWCWHRRHARCGGLLGLLWSWWSAVVGAPCACLCACGGGMLSGFWGSAPWLPGLLSAACLWVVGVGVGGLVVNCIVDASILL